jgi:hypothetical protein
LIDTWQRPLSESHKNLLKMGLFLIQIPT